MKTGIVSTLYTILFSNIAPSSDNMKLPQHSQAGCSQGFYSTPSEREEAENLLALSIKIVKKIEHMFKISALKVVLSSKHQNLLDIVHVSTCSNFYKKNYLSEIKYCSATILEFQYWN